MIRFLIIIISIVSTIYPQVIYSGSIEQQMERWCGHNSNNIVDYVLKLKKLTLDETIRNNFYMVMRTQINGINPIEYQIILRKDIYGNNNANIRNYDKFMIVFEHPVGKSIQKQFDELLELNSNISFEDASKLIKIKRDTIYVDSSFKYYRLINEVYKIEIPVIFERLLIPNGTKLQFYMENFTNEHYSLLPFGYKGNGFTEWTGRLFFAMIEYFNAIDPYKDYK